MSKKPLTNEEKKILLEKKKRIELLKKKKEQEAKKASMEKSLFYKNEDLLTDKERIDLAKDLKNNAIGVFARFNFYKDGYKKTLGILIFTLLTMIFTTCSLFYALFVFKAPNGYIPVDSYLRIESQRSLLDPIYTDEEIINYASQAYRKINEYNYVNIDKSYISDISPYFSEKTLASYKEQFFGTNEFKYIKENSFIVQSVILKGAKINVEETKRIQDKSPNMKFWVVDLRTAKIYQNEKFYIKKDYLSRVRIARVNQSVNEKGIIIQSIIDIEEKEEKNNSVLKGN